MKGCMHLSKDIYLDLSRETGMGGCKPTYTPIDLNQKLGEI